MLNHYEVTILATPEQLGTTREAMAKWFHENLEPLPEPTFPPQDHLTGHLTGKTEGFVAAYKYDEDHQAELWRLEKKYDDERFVIVINCDLFKFNDDKVLCFDKEVIRALWMNTELDKPIRDGFGPMQLRPKNAEYFCVGPNDWWKGDFERVSEATTLNSFVYLNIKPWLASNPGKTPLDYPVIKLNGGEIIPREHAEWFKDRFSELMTNFYNAQESISLVDTEIRIAARELESLKAKRLRIFEGL